MGADLRHRPCPGGERPVDPGERRPGQQHRGPHDLRRAADGDPPCRHVDVGHVAALAVAAVAHAAALPHRDELDGLHGAGRASLAVHHLGGMQVDPPGQEALTAFRAPDEADVLAVRLGGGAQPETAGVGPHLVLGHVTHREDDARQRVLAQHGQDVGLVLEGIGAPAELPDGVVGVGVGVGVGIGRRRRWRPGRGARWPGGRSRGDRPGAAGGRTSWTGCTRCTDWACAPARAPPRRAPRRCGRTPPSY